MSDFAPRKLKFRAWDTENKTWVNLTDAHMNPLTGLIMNDEDNSCSDPQCCGGPSPYWVDQPHIVLMQFTGLFDKNGKEAFEKDIVRVKCEMTDTEHVGVITYYPNVAYFAVEVLEIGGHLNFGIDLLKEFEIIGNVWENPELLEKT